MKYWGNGDGGGHSMLFLLCASLAMLLSGCMTGAFFADMTTAFQAPIEWKEEVLLQDGRSLIVERRVSFGVGGKMTGGPPIKSYELDFVHPDSHERIHWDGAVDLMPMLLGYEDGKLYFAADPYYGCSSWMKYGRKDSWYFLFRYENGVWESIPQEDFRLFR